MGNARVPNELWDHLRAFMLPFYYIDYLSVCRRNKHNIQIGALKIMRNLCSITLHERIMKARLTLTSEEHC